MTRPAASLPLRAHGDLGAIAAAHPLAVGAGVATFAAGGSAVDAAIAAQAVLGVVLPQACGIGGDALFLLSAPDGTVTAVNGTGRAAVAGPDPRVAGRSGATVTVPGQVAAWEVLHQRWGAIPLGRILAPAVRLARAGTRVDAALRQALDAQQERLVAGGAAGWPLLDADIGSRPEQGALAATLDAIGREGPSVFYRGPIAARLCEAVAAAGGGLAPVDLETHETVVRPPVSVDWDGGTAYVQPPVSQGVLLAMALRWLERDKIRPGDLEHVCVELTEAVFAHRDRVGGDEADRLQESLEIDPHRATGRGGPRAYLHTAGVATADRDGLVVSSLASVFDDFGSGCFVPEGGFVLNNRAEGFTDGPNRFAPGARPVHTLAPALVRHGEESLALATPGADGQVQTLLQVLCGMRWAGRTLEHAVDAPRWRSEGGRLLVEASHAGSDDLRRRGHDVVHLANGDERFGAVVAAGFSAHSPHAVADWRRHAATGAI